MPEHTVGTREQWLSARKELLDAEKEHMRRGDELARRRRELPWVPIEKVYTFETARGSKTLADLFDGRSQLLVYHFMFGVGYRVDEQNPGCTGCSFVADNVCHLSHLHARNTSLVLVSLAPLPQIEAYRKRMGWTIPWYSSAGSDFNTDFGLSTDAGETFGLSVFLRDGDDVLRSYFTTGRGVEALGSAWTFLDLTPFGRQETWEDSPPGTPQTAPYEWWRRHDEYDS